MEFEQDLPETSNEALLATLGGLANGVEDDGDILSSGILDFLPQEVQLADPPVKAMIEECGAVLDAYLKEVEHKHRFHRRRLVEVIKARELCGEKSEESRALRERLKHARGSLTGKLEEEYLAEQRLRWSIEQQVKHNRMLTERLNGGVQRLKKREEQLSADLIQEDALQASLMEQLQASTDEEERLRSTLESARAALALEWVRDNSRKAALAEENASARSTHERLRSELSEVERSRRSSLDAAAASTLEDEDISDFEPEEVSGSGEADDGADDDQVDDDERAIRAARMERRYTRKQERLAELRDKIERAELSTSEMEVQLDQLEAAIAATAETLAPPSIDPAGVEHWSPEMGEDVLAKVREIDSAICWLRDGKEQRSATIERHRRLQGTLDGQVAELSELQGAIASTEESCEACDRAIETLRARLAEMSTDIECEQDALREEEWSSQRRRHTFRLQVDEQRSKLQQSKDACRDLMLQRGRKKKRSFSTKRSR